MTKKYLEKNKELEILYEEFKNIMLANVLRFNDSQIVASTMVALALRLYKSTLTDEEYKDMLKIVVKNAKKIEPFVINSFH